MNMKPRTRPGTASNQSPNECVQVVVRCRPLSNRERADGPVEVVSVFPSRGVVEIINPNESNKEQRKVYTYDAAYDGSASQTMIYNEVVFPLVSSVLEGFNGCIFAYGQTGTGKTFTMEGIRGHAEMMGIIPRTFEQIWLHINRTENFQFLVDVSYLEIYMEELRDLLKPQSKHLEVRERNSGVYVPNLHTINCKSVDDMLNVMHIGNKNRTVGFTNMNEHSSRSHAIFMIKIEMCDNATNIIKVGKLNLIDLAGSERQSKTGASAERLKEASKINLALSSLGNVISALAENVSHVPYRDSKLTRLLQDSLGGNSKTIMIANIGPSSYNYNETLTTLRYASRAKTIQNQPVKNEDPQDAKLREYQEEIERLRKLIAPKKQQIIRSSSKKRTKKPKNEKNVKNVIVSSDSTLESSPNKNINSDAIVVEKLSESEAELETDEDSENEENNDQEYVAKSKEDLERERVENTKLAAKLAELESQLVRGGQNLLDTYSERQIELEKKLVEIAERKKREIEIQQQLELQEETTLEIRDTVTSLEQEVELKKRKLSKCYAKYLSLQQELNDCKYEHNQDLRELEMAQNELVKELKRQLLIIDNFVPVEVKIRLYTQAKYDEEQEEWTFSDMTMPTSSADIKRPVAHNLRRRPISEYSIQATANATGAESYRFKSENILNYELDMPCRTTQEYRSPRVSASLQAVLAQAMKTDGDIDIVDSNSTSLKLRNRLDQIISTNTVSNIYVEDTSQITSNLITNDKGGSSCGVSNLSNSAMDSKRRAQTGRSQLKKPASAYPKARGLNNLHMNTSSMFTGGISPLMNNGGIQSHNSTSNGASGIIGNSTPIPQSQMQPQTPMSERAIDSLGNIHQMMGPATPMTPMTPGSADPGIVPQLQNIVSTVNLCCKLDLKKIALHARNAEYNPKRFAAVIMRIREPRTTALIFSSGKMVCTGAKSEDDSRLAARKYARIIQKLGFPAKFLDFKIQNMVGSCDVKFPIRLEGLVLTHCNFSSYEPELFPGLIYRMVRPRIVLLIFVSGKVVLTGAKVRQEIYEAFDKIFPILKKFKK